MDSYVYLHHHLHHHLYLCLYLCLCTLPPYAHACPCGRIGQQARLSEQSFGWRRPLQSTSPYPMPSPLREPRRLRLPKVPRNRRPELTLQITREQAARPANLRGAELRWTLSWLRLIASACRPLHWPLPPVVLLLLLLPLPLPLLVVGSSGRES